jgi:hypothetical protein
MLSSGVEFLFFIDAAVPGLDPVRRFTPPQADMSLMTKVSCERLCTSTIGFVSECFVVSLLSNLRRTKLQPESRSSSLTRNLGAISATSKVSKYIKNSPTYLAKSSGFSFEKSIKAI